MESCDESDSSESSNSSSEASSSSSSSSSCWSTESLGYNRDLHNCMTGDDRASCKDNEDYTDADWHVNTPPRPNRFLVTMFNYKPAIHAEKAKTESNFLGYKVVEPSSRIERLKFPWDYLIHEDYEVVLHQDDYLEYDFYREDDLKNDPEFNSKIYQDLTEKDRIIEMKKKIRKQFPIKMQAKAGMRISKHHNIITDLNGQELVLRQDVIKPVSK